MISKVKEVIIICQSLFATCSRSEVSALNACAKYFLEYALKIQYRDSNPTSVDIIIES